MKNFVLRPASCVLLAVALAAAAVAKPNIVLFVADDMGFADCGVTGCKDIPTPNIDALAKNGVRFTNGYTSGCVCSPTRAGLISGRYQQRFGFDANAEGKAKGGEDRAPRAFAHAGGVVQHARNRGDGDPGHLGNMADIRHGNA